MGPAADILILLLAWVCGFALVGGWGLGMVWLLGLAGLFPEKESSVADASWPSRTGAGGRLEEARQPLPILVDATGSVAWWLGLPPLLLFLQVWHLFLPIDAMTWLPVSLVAVAGAWAGRRALARWAEAARARPLLLVGVALGAVALAGWVVAGHPLRPGAFRAEVSVAWEPAVQLGRQWALPPGVANLSAPLGLQHAATLLASLMSTGPWSQLRGEAVTAGVALGVAASALAGLGEVLRVGRRPERELSRGALAQARYNALGGWLATAWLVAVGVHSPSPGVPAGALLFVACGQAFRGASAGLSANRGERIDRLATCVVLSAAAAAAHPPIAAAALPLAFWAGWLLLGPERALLEARRSTRSVGLNHASLPGARARQQTVIVTGLFAVALPGLWVLRSVWASGHPVFPFVDVALSVEWRAPGSTAASLGELLGGEAPLARLPAQVGSALLPAALGAALWLAWLIRGGIEGRHRRLAPLPLVLGLGLSLGLFLPGAMSAMATNAAIAGAIAASGVVAARLGGRGVRAQAGVQAARGGVFVGGVLAGGLVVGGVTWATPMALGSVLAPAPRASSPAMEGASEGAAMVPWVSQWGAEVVVAPPRVHPDARPTWPGIAPMPAAARPPSPALRERRPGEPQAGYVIDRRDPDLILH